MNGLILLAAIAAVPAVIGLLLRVHAVFLFAAAAGGSLLVTYVGDDAGLALGMLVKTESSHQLAQYILLFLPVVLTLMILRRSASKSVFLLHIPVIIATGMTLAVLALPLLDSNVQSQIFANKYGDMARQSQDVIVGAATVMAMLLALLTGRHKEDKKKHHK